MKKLSLCIILITVLIAVAVILTGCAETKTETQKDIKTTLQIGDRLSKNQSTPKDIDYSLERYNLIRRTYWVNGQREKANTLICEVEKPLGYIALFLDNGACVGRFVVDGKVTSLNSFLTPSSDYEAREYYAGSGKSVYSIELPDVDGSYGENDGGIFFFTPDGKYIEWTGTYLYSDIPFQVKDTVITYKEVE